jgi:hypothetical protein
MKLERRHWIRLLIAVLLVWAVFAYLFAPAAWHRYSRRHPLLDDIPTITYTGSGLPADVINVALIGTETQLKKIMIAAKWYPADPLTLRSCLEIAEATVLKKPYDDAPVSNLFFQGRKEDLAFEKPVGDNPRKRHHVRFWRSDKTDPGGRHVWVGSATYDERVELSRTTGQFTHRTAPDIDAERDLLIANWQATGMLSETYIVSDFQKKHEGRNGEGDPWRTDGNLWVGVTNP